MARFGSLLGASATKLGRRIQLLVGSSAGITVGTVTADVTFDGDTGPVARINPSTQNQNVALYVETSLAKGLVQLVQNVGTTYNLVVKSGATTVATLAPGDWGMFFTVDGTTYYAMTTSSVVGALATILATASTWSAKQTFGAVRLGGIVDSPMTAAQVLGAADTITLPTTGVNKALSSVAARTGLILTVGTIAGQLIVLENVNASDSLTFDVTPATSKVAAATCLLPAGTAKLFTWNATTSLWYPVG